MPLFIIKVSVSYLWLGNKYTNSQSSVVLCGCVVLSMLPGYLLLIRSARLMVIVTATGRRGLDSFVSYFVLQARMWSFCDVERNENCLWSVY